MRAALPLSLMLAFGVVACSSQSDAPASDAPPAPASVQVTDAWCRPSPNGARVGACYLTLTAAQDDRLTGFSTPSATKAEIHTMSTEGGMMQMRQLTEGVALPAGRSVALKPGAEHLMLIDLVAPLVEGQDATLNLTFQSAPAITVQASIQAPAAAGGHGATH